MDTRDKLQLFQDLKNSSLPNASDGLDELLEKKDIFDINPNTNYEILKKSINSYHKDLLKNFYSYNQTLTFSQRQDIIKKLKKTDAFNSIQETIGLSEESFFQKYFMLLKDLQNFFNDNTFDNYKKIKKSFRTIYYVDNTHIKIPYIYGTTELRYSGLINNLYQCLFVNQKEKKEGTNKMLKDKGTNKMEKEEGTNKMEKEIGNIQETTKKEGIKADEDKSSSSSDVITKHKTITNINDNISFNINKNNNSNIIEMDIDNEEEEQEDDEEVFNSFNNTIIFISHYLNMICNDEFLEFFNVKNYYKFDETQKFSRDYKLNPEIDSLYFHLLFLDLLVTIYSSHGKNNYDKSMKDIFFETKKNKLAMLMSLKKYCKFMKNNEEITFTIINEIKNENYVMVDLKDKNNSFIFNPYDYTLQNISFKNIKKFQDIVNAFNNSKNFSLNKIYKDKILFVDKNVYDEFKDNIKDMLTSKVINQLYNQFINYKKYENPYSGKNKENFIQQTFDIILFMPIPFNNIAGYTYKNFGIIFLTSKEPSKRNSLPNTYFLKKICNISFKKVVTIHEIIGHYCPSLFHGNDPKYNLKTSDITLIDYIPKEKYEYDYSLFDGGERGESILFGNKIRNIFIKGALYILDNNNFDNNLDDFREKFVEINNPKNCTDKNFNLEEESKKYKIISLMKNENKNIENLIKITPSNSNFSFRASISEEGNEDQIFEDGVLYWNRITHKDITIKKRKIKY